LQREILFDIWYLKILGNSQRMKNYSKTKRVRLVILAGLISFLGCFVVAEIASLYLLERNYRLVEERYNRWARVDGTNRVDEMQEIYFARSEFHPYRWYYLPPNFAGKTVELDRFGFRNLNSEIDSTATKKIAFYGGSTMFSTTTVQKYAIPNLIQKTYSDSDVQALNFGVGGYASSAELNTFIETIRLIPSIKYAVFYDGVNEVGRFIEKLQNRNEEPLYSVVSYPFLAAFEAAIYRREYRTRKHSFPYSVYFVRKAIEITTRDDPPPINVDYESAAVDIARIYLENLRDIQSIARDRKIETMFLLQPVIYTTKNLTQPEVKIASSPHLFDMSKLHLLAYEKINEMAKSFNVSVVDISDVLSEKDVNSDVFLDYCHLNELGNAKVAEKIGDLMALRFPELKFSPRN
jgi:lysophospholipase L1-like esterase